MFQNGEVIDVDTDEVYGGRSIPYFVRTEDGAERWYAENEVCEPAKPAKPETVAPPLKFKVGDRVFCGAAFGSFTPEHRFGTVRDVRTSGELRDIPYLIRVDGEDQNPPVVLWFAEDEVFAPRKFKVGDKVRAMIHGVECSAVVELVNPPSYVTRIPYFVATCDGLRHTSWVGDDQLTLEAPESTLKFKVGDRVAYPPNLQGVYTVVDARDDSLQLECVSTGARAWVSGVGLVAAPEPTLKFKVGDKVFCGRAYGAELYDPPIALVGEVVAIDTRRPSSGVEYVPYKVAVPGRDTLWFTEAELTDPPLVETAPLEICVGDIVTVEAGAQNFTTDPHIVRNVKVVAINLVGTRKVYLAALPASVGWVAFDTTDTITLVKAGGAK